MASSVTVPVLATAAVAFANDWYNRGAPDLKIPVAGAIAALIATGAAQVPGLAPVITALGWLAFVGVLIAPVQSPSPVANLTKITGAL